MIRRVPFYRHDLGAPELDAIARVFDSAILTTGDTVSEFERRFAAMLGSEHCLGVTSCTGALHMSLLAAGIGAGDEVITTPMTFIATASAIIEAGATPVFVDVEPDTGNINADNIEAAITPRTKAIMPVHLYGLMCDMRAIAAIAKRYNLKIFEDCAHCVEGERDGIRPGQLATTASFSFYATKNLTCGEGGAVITNDRALLEKLKLLRLHGMTKTAADREREGYSHWDMVSMGWKYNMDNIQAAMLLPQLDRLDAKLKMREQLAAEYRRLLANIPGLRMPGVPAHSRHALHLFPIWISPFLRDHFIQAMQRDGIGCVVNYRAVHLMSYFRETYGYRPGMFPVAEAIGDETVSIPFYPTMSMSDLYYVVERIAHFFREHAG